MRRLRRFWGGSNQYKKHMPLPAHAFLRLVGAIVCLRCVWCNPLLPYSAEGEEGEECLITHLPVSALSFAAKASDGRVYDAFALQRWGKRCEEEEREFCVVPSQRIDTVAFVRTRRLLPPFPSSLCLGWGSGGSPHKKRCRSVGTQTDISCGAEGGAPKRGRKENVRIPGEFSAFERVISASCRHETESPSVSL